MNFRVLVFPAGSEIGLEIHKSLCLCKDVVLWGASSPMSNHASFVYENYFELPMMADEHFIDALNVEITRHDITHLFPAYDDAVVYFADNRDRIAANVVTSPVETCKILRSKIKTYKHLSGIVPTPEILSFDEEIQYPVFIKPDIGQGSEGAYLIRSEEELRQKFSNDKLIMEYLPNAEFTIDCFSHRNQGLLYVLARERKRIKNGISVACAVSYDKIFNDYAQRIAFVLDFEGAWFYQARYSSDGVLKILEAAPRIAGTMALSRVRGVNLPLLSLYESENMPVGICENQEPVIIDRALQNRYFTKIDYNTVFIDLDDTLVINNKINTDAVAFLHQALNDGKKIVLLTKHAGNVRKVLYKYRIYELFDDVIQINADDEKLNYVCKNSIFIDDSFSERFKVYKSLKVPVFDVSMIECLLKINN